jgi:hypothetical protein
MRSKTSERLKWIILATFEIALMLLFLSLFWRLTAQAARGRGERRHAQAHLCVSHRAVFHPARTQ